MNLSISQSTLGSMRACSCKGVRTCFTCEKYYSIARKDFYSIYRENLNPYVFCLDCKKLQKGWSTSEVLSAHINHNPDEGIPFPGILVVPNFLTADEGFELVSTLDENPWIDSQSGRRKQHFGPKTNFKKMKLQIGNFRGFPEFSKFVQNKFKTVPEMVGYQTIEQCALEYTPETGASIEPHIDDCWIWGERVVTVNCLGDSVLTLVKYNGDSTKYNLKLADEYRTSLIGRFLTEQELSKYDNMVIRIPMPSLSLIVMYGSARFQFEHSVLREDINERRVCIAYREFTPMYLSDGRNFENGAPITEKAKFFWNDKLLNP